MIYRCLALILWEWQSRLGRSAVRAAKKYSIVRLFFGTSENWSKNTSQIHLALCTR
jgi:hypothetical protein